MARRTPTPEENFFNDHNPYDWDPGADDILHHLSRYAQFMNDDMSQWLLDTAFFNEEVTRADRTVARQWIEEYWEERWGYSFRDQFDWNGWRELVSPT